MLDDVDYLGADKTKPRGAGKYEGGSTRRSSTSSRGVLAQTPPETLIVVVAHIPFRTYLDPADPAQNLTNREALFALFEGRRFTVSFSGHTHTTEHHYFGAADGWTGATEHHHHVLTALSGSWWSGPFDHRGVAVRRQPRRNAQRLPYPVGRRQFLQDALRPRQGAERPADAALGRQPLPRATSTGASASSARANCSARRSRARASAPPR